MLLARFTTILQLDSFQPQQPNFFLCTQLDTGKLRKIVRTLLRALTARDNCQVILQSKHRFSRVFCHFCCPSCISHCEYRIRSFGGWFRIIKRKGPERMNQSSSNLAGMAE
ncbi:hypothetical protein WG66_002117 [Moniliophthora roreri]|nr:hypothetical protein WG66_002117 [Moniliophthora roreri]